MEYNNENKPFKTNQISQEKPNIKRTATPLIGYNANSFNGGHNKVIAYKQVMPGEQHEVYFWQGSLSMLTPITPTYQNLRITFRSYFVPDIAVFKGAEKFLSQKGGATDTKITEVPNLYGKKIPLIATSGTSQFPTTGVSLNATSIWRDSFISSYIPKINGSTSTGPESYYSYPLPKVSVLPLRGRVLIYNELERNKQYDPEMPLYTDDTVSDEEWNSYLPLDPKKVDFYFMRSRRGNSYYTDYRTELQGMETNIFGELESYTPQEALLRWSSTESKINEIRAQAENSEKTDWEIIHELFGSKKLTEGKPQKLGEVTVNMNYAAITQNAYNANNDIKPEFQVMGKQGAYSYTEVKIPCYAGIEFKEAGYIHIIATVSADSVFENAFDRLEMNCNALERYRPDMMEDKLDTLYLGELTTSYYANRLLEKYTETVGFKRRFTEYFKLPNTIGGDMCNDYIYGVRTNSNSPTLYGTNFQYLTTEKIYPNNTYQFFEKDIDTTTIKVYGENNQEANYQVLKFIWKDYTDLLINKNQAIQNVTYGTLADGTRSNIWVSGQNQIFYVGISICKAILPISDKIKNNFTDWGEH